MTPRTFFIRTFGCQMNEHDSDRIAQILERSGLHRVDEPREAGWIIINTCSVRAKPEHKALSEAGRFKHARRGRGARIVLAGCVARQEGRRLLERAPWLDAVVGPDQIGRLGELFRRIETGEGPLVAIEDHDERDGLFVDLEGPGRGISRLVTVMKGCNNFCAYCIVPYVRGREVSRPRAAILAEVETLARGGAREVCLLGQNVNSYRDPTSGADFQALLRDLDRQAAVERIRFTTSHPKDLGEELIDALAELPRVVEHLHLALQAGSDRILHAMRRGYTRSAFLEKVARLRSRVPGIALTTDLIVGFPGETEADFEDTLGAVREAAFESAFSFKYSPRPGTLAATFPDDVPGETKQARLERLQSLLSEIEARSLARLVGQRLEVLVEGPSVRGETWTGRSRCNRVVNFEPGLSPPLPGETREVAITEVRGHTLAGRSVRE